MYRQGDLLITPAARRPSGVDIQRPVTSGVVEFGEATGHAHVLEDGQVYNNGTVLFSPGEARLVHDEHDTIVLPEGWYNVRRQREFLGNDTWGDVRD